MVFEGWVIFLKELFFGGNFLPCTKSGGGGGVKF